MILGIDDIATLSAMMIVVLTPVYSLAWHTHEAMQGIGNRLSVLEGEHRRIHDKSDRAHS